MFGLRESMMPLDGRFLRYLLGEMDSDELVGLEGEYFADASVFAALCQTERDLLLLYRRGRLPATLSESVARSYGVTAERRAKIAVDGAPGALQPRLWRPSRSGGPR